VGIVRILKYSDCLLLSAFSLRFIDEKSTTEIAQLLNINLTYLREVFWGKQRVGLTHTWNLLHPDYPVRKIKHPSGTEGLKKIRELRETDPDFEKTRAENISLATDKNQKSKTQKDKMQDGSNRERIAKAVTKSWDKRSVTIQVKSYPLDLTFKIKVKLPPFIYGCDVRTKIIQKKLTTSFYSASHRPNDFIVEEIEKTEFGEIWHLGS